MVVVSYSGKEINAKLVYYGCGLSGKTTNLESIYEAVPDTSRGKMVSMKTQSDRTLFFDLLPLDLGEIMGFKTRFLLYTVPGQVFYNATRKLVLKGADAIVFVADSEVGKMEENKESLANLRANLAEYGLSLDNIPWVIQFNKRDLPNVYTIDELGTELNPGGKIACFEAVAKDGKGVFETFRGISHMLMEKVTRDLRRGSTAATAPGSAPATPATTPAAASAGTPAVAATGAARPAAGGDGPDVARPKAPPTAPAMSPHLVQREAKESPAYASRDTGRSVDYGRELDLPLEPSAPVRSAAPVASTPAPSATGTSVPPSPGARTGQTPAATPAAPRPAPVGSASTQAAIHRSKSAGPAGEVATPPRSGWAAPAAGSARPAASVTASATHGTSPPAPGLASPVTSEEIIVPIQLSTPGTHEIVLRIVLKLEG